MLKTLAIVEARIDAPPLRGKFARKLGGHSLLEHVVRRVTDCERLDQVIVAARPGIEAQRAGELVPADVPVFAPAEPDALARLVAALEVYGADGVVRVGAENPFIEPVFIDRLITAADEHPGYDYLGYCSSSGRPAVSSSLGLFAEWYSAAALRRADRLARTAADRNQVTSYLFSHPAQFQLRLMPVPTELDHDDVRLTIESEEDWEHAETIFDALGPDELDWQRIAGLLRQQPALRERMAVLNRG
jgi:spore coat polysaccharide biosynthesis protein SpsF